MADRTGRRRTEGYFLPGVLSFTELEVSLLDRDASLAGAVSLWGVSALPSEVEDDAEPLRLDEPAPDDFLA